jgi:hypothetical protein
MWSSVSAPTDSSFSSGRSATDGHGPRDRAKVCLLFGLLVSGLGLAGCPLAWQRVSVNEVIKPEDVTFFVPGQTTLHDVVARVGAPDELSDSDSGPVAHYHFRDFKRFRVNFGYLLKFFTPPGVPDDLILHRGGAGTEELLVFFDRSWVVRQHAFAHHANASRFRAWPFDDPDLSRESEEDRASRSF